MKLDDIRIKINKIDDEMRALYNDRIECSKQVAEVKLSNGDEVFKPERERDIEERFSDDENGYLIYIKKIIQLSRKLQYSEFINAKHIDEKYMTWLNANSVDNENTLFNGGTLSLTLQGDKSGMRALKVNDIISVIADTGLELVSLSCEVDTVKVSFMVKNTERDKKEAGLLSYMLFKESMRDS